MAHDHRTYIPAAGHDWLLPFYDVVTSLMGGASLHRQLVDQACLEAGQRVLEIGCGTGNLTTMVKTLHPAVDVVGLDPDPKALERARRKAEQLGVRVDLDRGFADDLTYPDASYDRVLSALMFHHLDRDGKERSLRQIRRVLKAGGSLHLLDFGATDGHPEGMLARALHRSDHMRDNARDTVLAFMRDAGFAEPSEVGQRRTIFGRVLFYQASNPQPA